MANQSIASLKYSSRQLQRWFWVFLLLNIAFIIWSRYYLRPLETSEIIRFEIAKRLDVAETILRGWQTPDNSKFNKAVQAISIDFFFIVLYVAGLSIACIYFSGLTGHEILRRAGRFFLFLVIGAGICDVIENIAMWYSLHGYLTLWNITVAYDMAVTKFSIIIVSFLFILVCLIFYVLRKLERKT